jgi:hypothetical protein
MKNDLLAFAFIIATSLGKGDAFAFQVAQSMGNAVDPEELAKLPKRKCCEKTTPEDK